MIDCSVECTRNMLMQAKEIGLLELNFEFFLANLVSTSFREDE